MCSKELSHCDSSFEYPQHMFWLRDKKIKFSLHTLITKVLNRDILSLYPIITPFDAFEIACTSKYYGK